MKLLLLLTFLFSGTYGFIQSFSNPLYCLKHDNDKVRAAFCPSNFNATFNLFGQPLIAGCCICDETLDLRSDCCKTDPSDASIRRIHDDSGEQCLTMNRDSSLVWRSCGNRASQLWISHEQTIIVIKEVDRSEPHGFDTLEETEDPKDTKDSKDSSEPKEPELTAFDYGNTLLHYKLFLDWNSLNTDIRDEEYIPCSLLVNNEIYDAAGCRYKGSAGSLEFCLIPGTDIISDRCKRLSIKVDPNYFETDKKKKDNTNKVLGQKKLQFHAMALDDSMFAERTAYHYLEEIGVAAPKAVHCRVSINNNYHGIYLLVQQIDDEFTEQYFADDANEGKGGLYKDTLFSVFTEAYFDRTHEAGKNEHAFMFEVAHAISTATTYEESVNIVTKYFDFQTLSAIIAFNTVVGQTDDWQTLHNFYWYVREDSEGIKKLVMIPWDYDRTDDITRGRERGDAIRSRLPGWWEVVPIGMIDQRCTSPFALPMVICTRFAQVLVTAGMKYNVNNDIIAIANQQINEIKIWQTWNQWIPLIEPYVKQGFQTGKTYHQWIQAMGKLMDHYNEYRTIRIPLS